MCISINLSCFHGAYVSSSRGISICVYTFFCSHLFGRHIENTLLDKVLLFFVVFKMIFPINFVRFVFDECVCARRKNEHSRLSKSICRTLCCERRAQKHVITCTFRSFYFGRESYSIDLVVLICCFWFIFFFTKFMNINDD